MFATTSCVSLARSVRIHTTRIPISDIHLSPREDFAIEGDAIVPASVAIIPWDSRYEMPPGVHGSRCFRPCIVTRYEIQSRCRKMEHPLSMFRNVATVVVAAVVILCYLGSKVPEACRTKSYVRHIGDMNNIRACA